MPACVVLAACVSLVSLQLSGLHLHVNNEGVDSEPHGTHPHDGATDGHDHEGDTDVSILELSTSSAKLVLFLVSLGLLVLALLWPAENVLPSLATPAPAGRRTRWRPPLRAPPFPTAQFN